MGARVFQFWLSKTLKLDCNEVAISGAKCMEHMSIIHSPYHSMENNLTLLMINVPGYVTTKKNRHYCSDSVMDRQPRGSLSSLNTATKARFCLSDTGICPDGIFCRISTPRANCLMDHVKLYLNMQCQQECITRLSRASQRHMTTIT